MRRPGWAGASDAGLVGPSVETGFYTVEQWTAQQGIFCGNLHFKVTLAAVWK